MKTILLFASLLLSATTANAMQDSDSAKIDAALASPPMAAGTAQIEATTGPVTVHWGQPSVLPNAADYQVQVADLDRNGDGVISRREVPAGHALASEFILVDRNHNGLITAAELANWH